MRILIADDDSEIRTGLAGTLREQGHDVLTAVDGHEALVMARQHRPDLALLDIKMPYTDGLQAAEALARAQPIPILIMTAFVDADLVERAADAPIYAYLVKPVRPEELHAAITVAAKRFDEWRALHDRTDQLEAALHARKLIDRAKGKLMAGGMTEARAYHYIQSRARRTNQSMSDVARAILARRVR